jgi:thiol-disulfide isomerase/thioredoxin
MPMRLGTPIPSLDGATEVFNESKSTAVRNNQVTLVHFFAVSCHICHETMNEVVRISEQYEADGLKTIAVHMPRQESDTDIEKVRSDIFEYHMSQPVLVDNNHTIAGHFENEYVPAFFVFGDDGTLKFRAAGDKGFQKVEPKIREALRLNTEKLGISNT